MRAGRRFHIWNKRHHLRLGVIKREEKIRWGVTRCNCERLCWFDSIRVDNGTLREMDGQMARIHQVLFV